MHEANFTIRVAKESESIAISHLVNSAYRGKSGQLSWTSEASFIEGQRVDPELIAEKIQSQDTRILLALELESDRIVGCVELKQQGSACYLGLLTVDVRFQRSGLGSLLLSKSEDFARNQLKASKIFMHVIGRRLELIEWYRRRGYNCCGARETFPYGEERIGIPRLSDLYFEILQKNI